MASTVYNRGKFLIANLGWPNIDVRALILTHASTLPAGVNNVDLNFVSELLAVSGVTEAAETGALSGYVRKTLASETVVEDDTGDQANLDAADISYAATESGRWVAIVLYREGASDAARDLIALLDIEDSGGNPSPLVTNGGTVDLVVNTAGLLGIA